MARSESAPLNLNTTSTPTPSLNASNAKGVDASDKMQDYNMDQQATFAAIDQYADQDVEMQAPPHETRIVVVDTNVLLQDLGLLQTLVDECERCGAPLRFVIPIAVRNELDWQKKDAKLSWFSRTASKWILTKMKEKEKSLLKGQATDQVFSKENIAGERSNDRRIVDCCMFFHRTLGLQTWLLTRDINISTDAMAEGIPTLNPAEDRSSYRLVQRIFEHHHIDPSLFSGARSKTRYKSMSVVQERLPTPPPDDGMDVDDDAAWGQYEVILITDARDDLHAQIIEHFRGLLMDLVGRVGGDELRTLASGGAASSIHAPKWMKSKKPYTEWKCPELLDYLWTKGKKRPSAGGHLVLFLGEPYVDRGARPGREWSARQWQIALEALAEVGKAWEDPGILGSLQVLKWHYDNVFR